MNEVRRKRGGRKCINREKNEENVMRKQIFCMASMSIVFRKA
jgi:hypothetical protein